MLGGKRYADFLTKSDQIITGNVKINGNLVIRNNLQIKNIQTNSHYCGHDLSALIRDAFVLSEESTELKQINGDKYFTGNLAFEKVIILGDVFRLGQWQQIEISIDDLKRGVDIAGNFIFSNEFRIQNLVIDGAINGIPSNEFGKQWLLTESDQVFKLNEREF